jgi:homoserine kinase
VAVSGAGPTVMAIVRAGGEAAVGAAMQEAYRRSGFDTSLHLAAIDPLGARVLAS